ncbi:hypothetical protein MP638_005459 [Amoeboaphelidium occidentale]|nr:hypothetical protein MP638_005459 [Amoeboaphelidium occidentale]
MIVKRVNRLAVIIILIITSTSSAVIWKGSNSKEDESLLSTPSVTETVTITSTITTATTATTTTTTTAIPTPPGNDEMCFNCNLKQFNCINNGKCDKGTGQCLCDLGYGGKNCSEPLCGGLDQPEKDRRKRSSSSSKEEDCCSDGFQGQVCNVCSNDDACRRILDPKDEGLNATCYKGGVLVDYSHYSCKITNEELLELIPGGEVAFQCSNSTKECFYTLWKDREEVFQCTFQDCVQHRVFEKDAPTQLTSKGVCKYAQCACIRGRFACGDGSIIDLDNYLKDVKGPAYFDCRISPDSNGGGGGYDGGKFNCMFKEEMFVHYLGGVLGVHQAVELDCAAGECMYGYQVPDRVIPPGYSLVFMFSIIGSVVVALMVIGLCSYSFIKAFQKQQMYSRIGIMDHTDEDVDGTTNTTGGGGGVDHLPATVTFSNITYEIVKHGQRRKVLKGVYGQVKPGEVLAILGTSGAGKTTCLDILAGKSKAGFVSGSLLINGKTPTREQFKRISGYVDQEDTLLETLTVYETLMFSAELRLPKSMSYAQKRRRVSETMIELGIEHIANSRVGSSGKRGISGGEKRRVSIAMELVTSPSVLYLDEPTSGLDSYNAYSVVQCLTTLAKKYNRTIILSIHQPRSNIFALFDKLLLLAEGGYMVYSGPIFAHKTHEGKSNLEEWLKDIGAECPPGFNLADYLIDMTKTGLIPAENDVSGSGAGLGIGGSSANRYSSASEQSQAEKTDSQIGMKRLSAPSTPTGFSGQKAVTLDMNDVAELQSKYPHLYPLVMGFLKSKACYEMNESISREIFSHTPGHHNTATSAAAAANVHPNGPASPSLIQPKTPDLQQEQIPSPEAGDINDIDYTNESSALLPDNTPHSARLGDVASVSESSSLMNDLPRFRFMFESLFGLTIPNQRDRIGLWDQFIILSKRTFMNFYRNPFLMYAHYGIAIFLAVTLGTLYFKVSTEVDGFQNRLGYFFVTFVSFALMSLSSLEAFSNERLLFIRERSNGYYGAFVYYIAKVLFDIIPLRVGPALVLGSISYFMVGLQGGLAFPKFLLVLVLFNMTTAAMCFVIAAMCGRQVGLALMLGILMLLFSMTFSGFFLNKSKLPTVMSVFPYLSFFGYAFEAVLVNEIPQLTLRDPEIGIPVSGVLILKKFGFVVGNYWFDTLGLFVYLLGLLVIGFIVLQFFVKEKR